MTESRKIFKYLCILALSSFLAMCETAFANTTTVNLNLTASHGVGADAGTVDINETPYGLLFTPHLKGLVTGEHGFHVHVNPACDTNGMAAGGHFDPANTGKHLGPYNSSGHLGDLPVMFVNADGTSTTPVLAPRLHHLSEITNHALMVHQGGDNYSDTPQKLGGGGARMACGIIKVTQ